MTEPKFPELALHVGGRWIRHASGGERTVFDPSDEAPLAVLPLAGAEEIHAAAESAGRGFQAWRRTLAHERYVILWPCPRKTYSIADDQIAEMEHKR